MEEPTRVFSQTHTHMEHKRTDAQTNTLTDSIGFRASWCIAQLRTNPAFSTRFDFGHVPQPCGFLFFACVDISVKTVFRLVLTVHVGAFCLCIPACIFYFLVFACVGKTTPSTHCAMVG